jgi:hypothetical protein
MATERNGARPYRELVRKPKPTRGHRLVGDERQEVAHALRMRRLLYGHLVSRALCSIAALRIPDLIGDGAMSATELAGLTATHALSLRQTMRALTTFGVFVEHPDGTFGLTPLGATLRDNAPASAWPTAMLVRNEIGQSWNQFEITVRTGHTAFSEVFGTDFFSYVDLKPETRAIFDLSQAAGLALDLDRIVEGLDLSGFGTIVDVGAGDGALLVHLLRAYPQARGIVLDLPRVAAKARTRMAEAGLAERCEIRSGDFFGTIPGGGDLYLLRQILHDWDDEHCVQLLRTCRAAMPPNAVLLIIELIVEERALAAAAGEMTALMDLYMLSIFDGKERTRSEFADLLAAAGFAITELTLLDERLGAIAAVPVGASPDADLSAKEYQSNV